jgi:hypothetical protein
LAINLDENPIKIIVEGKDELNVFKELFTQKRVRDIQILSIGGKNNLPGNLGALKEESNFRSIRVIGILRDADDNPRTALDSVKPHWKITTMQYRQVFRISKMVHQKHQSLLLRTI